MNTAIIKTTCLSCTKNLLAVAFGLALLAALAGGAIWGAPLIAVPIWRDILAPLWQRYCAFMGVQSAWLPLYVWTVPAIISTWTLCVAVKLAKAHALAECRIFGLASMVSNIIALLSLTQLIVVPVKETQNRLMFLVFAYALAASISLIEAMLSPGLRGSYQS